MKGNFFQRKKVNKGFLVYTRSKNKLITEDIKEKNIEEVKICAEEIYQIIDNNYFPKATKYKSRCTDCTYRNICIQ